MYNSDKGERGKLVRCLASTFCASERFRHGWLARDLVSGFERSLRDANRARLEYELKEAQRAELLKLAAQRGEKGFSSVIGEAIDLYLAQFRSRRDAVQRALAAEGMLTESDGEALGGAGGGRRSQAQGRTAARRDAALVRKLAA
jgi:hypothetical protein